MPGGYDPWFFEWVARAESKHFWFRARNRVICETVRRLTATFPTGSRILEVGCGTGGILAALREANPRAQVMGMDLHPDALRMAKQRTDALLVAGDLRQPPFACPFNLVGAFDVLEHLPEDLQALSELRQLLTPGGYLLVTVPAHPELWSYFDVASRHCRRYRVPELREKLAACGLDVIYISEFMGVLYPLAWAKRKLLGGSTKLDREQSRRAAARELRVVPVLNALLTRWLGHEASRIAAGHKLRRGTSIIAVARN